MTQKHLTFAVTADWHWENTVVHSQLPPNMTPALLEHPWALCPLHLDGNSSWVKNSNYLTPSLSLLDTLHFTGCSFTCPCCFMHGRRQTWSEVKRSRWGEGMEGATDASLCPRSTKQQHRWLCLTQIGLMKDTLFKNLWKEDYFVFP